MAIIPQNLYETHAKKVENHSFASGDHQQSLPSFGKFIHMCHVISTARYFLILYLSHYYRRVSRHHYHRAIKLTHFNDAQQQIHEYNGSASIVDSSSLREIELWLVKLVCVFFAPIRVASCVLMKLNKYTVSTCDRKN